MIQDEDVDKTSSSDLVVVLGFSHDLATRRTWCRSMVVAALSLAASAFYVRLERLRNHDD